MGDFLWFHVGEPSILEGARLESTDLAAMLTDDGNYQRELRRLAQDPLALRCAHNGKGKSSSVLA